MKVWGNKTYRHESNPLEKEIHDKFIKHCSYNHDTMERIAQPIDNKLNPLEYLSEKEKKIMISTIQWLGSPVGQNFLKECGFEGNNKIPKQR